MKLFFLNENFATTQSNLPYNILSRCPIKVSSLLNFDIFPFISAGLHVNVKVTNYLPPHLYQFPDPPTKTIAEIAQCGHLTAPSKATKKTSDLL